MTTKPEWTRLLEQIGALDVLLSDPRPAVPLTDDERLALETTRTTLRDRAHWLRQWGFSPEIEVAAA